MTRTYTKSAHLLSRAKRVLAGGVSSEFRKYNHPHALFYERAEGSRIYDVDGNEYIDFTLSQGPLILGHNHPHVNRRVDEAAQRGQLYAGQHLGEIELAEKLHQHIPSAEMMRFCLDGSEAVQTAFRLARAKTGKPKFLRFEGHYHGWLDNVAWGLSMPSVDALGSEETPNVFPWTEGLPERVSEEFITIPWNNADLLQRTVERHRNELAAIITEPIMCNNGCVLPAEGYLQLMRDLCTQHNITCIFDEVITGFRTGLSGAQGYFGITPDLSIFAKAMASGYPISAIVGKRDWMGLLESGRVIHAGTMNSSTSTVAAALGTIEVLEEPGVYDRIYRLGYRLMDGLRELGQKHRTNLLVQGLGPMLHTGFTHLPEVRNFREVQQYDRGKLGQFVAALHDAGIRVIGRGLWYISAVHTDNDIDKALHEADRILPEL
jgi:glutamate-1-semialdehyde 2,1-aminomutase